MRSSRFSSLIKVKCEPELQAAVAQAAERDQTSVSEFLRRELRAALRTSADPDTPRPAGPASAMPAAA